MRRPALALTCALSASPIACDSEGGSSSASPPQSASVEQSLARIDARLDRFADRLAALEAKAEAESKADAPPAASPPPEVAEAPEVPEGVPELSVPVTLPKAEPAPAPAARSLHVEVTRRGTFVDGAAVTEEELERRLTALAKHPDASVIISADAKVPHAEVVAMIDVARTLGVERYALSTRKGS